MKWSLCLWSFLALAVKDGQNVNMDIGLDVMTHGHCNSLASGGMGFRYRVWVTLPRCLGQNLLSLGADLENIAWHVVDSTESAPIYHRLSSLLSLIPLCHSDWV